MKPQTLSFRNYRYNQAITSTQIAAAYNDHTRTAGEPAVIRVNPQTAPVVMLWLKSVGANADVQPNGGTFSNEIWIAAANEATP